MVTKMTYHVREHQKEQVVPPLKDVSASLFPLVNQGSVDVSSGQYDAGD
jgi:hypothetical protein